MDPSLYVYVDSEISNGFGDELPGANFFRIRPEIPQASMGVEAEYNGTTCDNDGVRGAETTLTLNVDLHGGGVEDTFEIAA